MKRARQLGFEILEGKNAKHFGGVDLKNSHAKGKRPISTKRTMHLVLRSLLAKGPLSFLRKDREIREIIQTQGKRFGVKVYRQATAGNHIHLVILPRSRDAFNGFIRAISGLIARLILGAERGRPASVLGSAPEAGFWEKRPFTRIVEWGREFRSVGRYLSQNTLEALGFIPYQPRTRSLGPADSSA